MRKGYTVVLVLVATVALAAVGPTALSAESYTGILTAPDCISGAGAWLSKGSSTFAWTVSRDRPSDPWHYSYSLSVPQGGIGYFIVETSKDVAAGDIFNLPLEVVVEVGTFVPDDGSAEEPVYPGLPGPIYGAKLSGFESLSPTIAFDSYKPPAWGDFYAKDGKFMAQWNIMYNKSFLDPDPTSSPGNGTVNCKILRPASTEVTPAEVMPEPTSIVLGAMGIVSVIVGRRRLVRGS